MQFVRVCTISGVVTYNMEPHRAVYHGLVNHVAFGVGCILFVYVTMFALLRRFVNRNGNVRMKYKDMQVHGRGYVEFATAALLSVGWRLSGHSRHTMDSWSVAVLTAKLFGFVALCLSCYDQL